MYMQSKYLLGPIVPMVNVLNAVLNLDVVMSEADKDLVYFCINAIE